MIEFIVNPTAGDGHCGKVASCIERYLHSKGIPHRILNTDYPNHAMLLAKEAVQRGAETVVAVGGDGTISETACGLMNTGVALGIIPAGTGNDYCKTVNIPMQWEKALEQILHDTPRYVNTGMVNERPFLNVCGVGFDVLVLEYTKKLQHRVRGMLSYLYGVICAIFHFSPIHITITLDNDIPIQGEYLLCTVANGRYIGGGIPIVPDADISDGYFDVLLVDAIKRWKVPFYLPALLMGKLHTTKIAHRYKAKTIVFSSSHLKVNVDGEIIPYENSVFSIQTNAMRLHWQAEQKG